MASFSKKAYSAGSLLPQHERASLTLATRVVIYFIFALGTLALGMG